MAHTTTMPEAAPAEDVGNDQPSFTFKGFTWAPDNFSRNVMVHAGELSHLTNHIKDVVHGAALVLQLMLAHDQEIDRDNATYLNPCYVGMLQQLAIRALQSFDLEADHVARRLNDLATGETNGGGA